MKKTIIIIIVILFTHNISAQQIYPLSTDAQTVPQYSYIKDTNSELDKFIGTWVSTFDNKIISIVTEKKLKKFIDRGIEKFYRDTIEMTFTIKDSNGKILQSTIQKVNIEQSKYHSINSISTIDNGNTLGLYYKGTNCGIGWGIIKITKIDSSTLIWKYKPNGSTFIENQCPSNIDNNLYLPNNNLIFTKQ